MSELNLLLQNMQTRFFKLKSPSTFSEVVALFCLLYVIFVMIKHLVFHTFYYNWMRSGRRILTHKINQLTHQTTTDRIIKFASKIYPNKSFKNLSANEISNLIYQFSKAKQNFQFFHSLLDARKEESFLNEINFEDNNNILLFLNDNCLQELFLILKNVYNKRCKAWLVEADN